MRGSPQGLRSCRTRCQVQLEDFPWQPGSAADCLAWPKLHLWCGRDKSFPAMPEAIGMLLADDLPDPPTKQHARLHQRLSPPAGRSCLQGELDSLSAVCIRPN